MKTMNVIIFGIGQLAEVLTYFIQTDTSANVVGYTIDSQYKKGSTFNNLPIICWEDIMSFFKTNKDTKLLCPMSYKNLNENRKEKYLQAKQWNIPFYSYIHSSVQLNTQLIGDNLIILEDCRIQPFSKIGNNCIFWSGTHVGHHSIIHDHCFFAGNGGVAGSSSVGECTFLGGNSVVGDNVNVGHHSVIGAGTTLTRDVKPFSVVMPAKSRVIEYTPQKIRKII